MNIEQLPNYIPYSKYKPLINGELKDYINNKHPLILFDEIGGFEYDLSNHIFDYLTSINCNKPILTEYIIDDRLRNKYPNLDIRFSAELKNNADLVHTTNYNIHPEINYKNFLCSFNRTGHIGRQLLVNGLHKFGMFNPDYCSKSFTSTPNYFDSFVENIEVETNDFNRKFFTDDINFLNNTFIFGDDQWDENLEVRAPLGTPMMVKNIEKLEKRLTESFIHLVSETNSYKYYPFVTEKFLMSVITRGLFVTFGQPDWHSHVIKYFGFKMFDIFDYSFDGIQNPIHRLVSLLSMIQKFSLLSNDDWNDLYQSQIDIIEFNYDHYFSGKYYEVMCSYE